MSKIAEFAAVALIGVASGFAGGVVAASVFAGRASIQKPPDVIRAKQFEAIEENGAVRARFGFSGGVPAITFLGSDGKERFSLTLDNVDEPNMTMKDTNDKARVVFGHETSDTASPNDERLVSFISCAGRRSPFGRTGHVEVPSAHRFPQIQRCSRRARCTRKLAFSRTRMILGVTLHCAICGR